MPLRPISYKNFIKGLVASVDRYEQPQGSFPRGSNLLLSKRGDLVTVDGSQIVHAFNGVPTAGRGRILSAFLFSPTGVPAYYLMIAQALDLPIGKPFNLVLTDGGAGGLLTGNIFYKVTAMDGVGGESLASAEATINVAANHKVTLTWNIVPNAAFYNVYRSFVSGPEIQIAAATLPVAQPAAGTLTATFTDDNINSVVISLILTTAGPFGSIVSPDGSQVTWNTTTVHNLSPGYKVACTNGGIPALNGTYIVQSTPTPNSFVTANINNVLASSAGGPGNVTALTPPGVDNTQQIVMFKMPVLPASTVSLPVAYNNSNIVALFPANLRTTSSPTSGGGGTGGGGTGGTPVPPVGGGGPPGSGGGTGGRRFGPFTN